MKESEESKRPDPAMGTGEAPPEVEDFLDLRPRKLSDYIGERQVVETLEIAIQAAQKRKEPLDHILFHSPPGLGKTTLAHIIATEMGVRIVTSSGPAIEKGGDLISILTHLERGDVFFIDEVHPHAAVVAAQAVGRLAVVRGLLGAHPGNLVDDRTRSAPRGAIARLDES